jgi:hypothetical protein
MTIPTAVAGMRNLEERAMGVAASATGIADGLRNIRDAYEGDLHRLIKDGGADDVDDRATAVEKLEDAIAVLDVLAASAAVFVRQTEALVDGLLEASQ